VLLTCGRAANADVVTELTRMDWRRLLRFCIKTHYVCYKKAVPCRYWMFANAECTESRVLSSSRPIDEQHPLPIMIFPYSKIQMKFQMPAHTRTDATALGNPDAISVRSRLDRVAAARHRPCPCATTDPLCDQSALSRTWLPGEEYGEKRGKMRVGVG